jgi:hypothetical protein
MAPRHIAPEVALRIMLIKEVIAAVMEEEPVGIIDPVLGGGEMEDRSKLFAVMRTISQGS